MVDAPHVPMLRLAVQLEWENGVTRDFTGVTRFSWTQGAAILRVTEDHEDCIAELELRGHKLVGIRVATEARHD